MKAVSVVDLEAGTKPGNPAKRTKPRKPKTTGKPGQLIRRTYSVYTPDDELINDTAAKLSMEKGKPVGASEALRHLLSIARSKS